MGCRVVPTPLGPLTLFSRNGALVALDWGESGPDAPDAVVEAAARQLADYFAGRRRDFDLPLAPAGSRFQRRVWAAMQEIPFGTTATYGDLARRLDSAPRAVGQACGRNPLPIVIPCHRVLGRHGLGGYSGGAGLATKLWLLNHEAVPIGPLHAVTSPCPNAIVGPFDSKIRP